MTLVIARGYGGQPLKRKALKIGRGYAYLANPENLKSVETGDTSPVGFPIEDVFLFNSRAYATLSAEWSEQSATNPSTWRGLKLIAP